MSPAGEDLGNDPGPESSMASPPTPVVLSELLLAFVKANPDQLEKGETAEEWVASLWKVRNPAARLKKSLEDFLTLFSAFDDPATNALREAIMPLTK